MPGYLIVLSFASSSPKRIFRHDESSKQAIARPGAVFNTKMASTTDEPEIVCKFRHPEMQRAAGIDVRPQIAGKYVAKFKEALPLKDQVGGYRLLFSHNVEFGLSQAPEGGRTSMQTLTCMFPAWRRS